MDSNTFEENRRLVDERRKREKEDYQRASSERLFKICSKKLDTTMIGAISAIEVALGELLNSDIRVRKAFDEARSKILDNGNNQKRNLVEEFKQYSIEWNRHTVILPVKPRN